MSQYHMTFFYFKMHNASVFVKIVLYALFIYNGLLHQFASQTPPFTPKLALKKAKKKN